MIVEKLYFPLHIPSYFIKQMELGRLGVRGVPVQKRVVLVPKVGLGHAPEHGAQERRVPITEAVHQTLRPAI